MRANPFFSFCPLSLFLFVIFFYFAQNCAVITKTVSDHKALRRGGEGVCGFNIASHSGSRLPHCLESVDPSATVLVSVSLHTLSITPASLFSLRALLKNVLRTQAGEKKQSTVVKYKRPLFHFFLLISRDNTSPTRKVTHPTAHALTPSHTHTHIHTRKVRDGFGWSPAQPAVPTVSQMTAPRRNAISAG